MIRPEAPPLTAQRHATDSINCFAENSPFFNFLPPASFRVTGFSNLPLHLPRFAFHQSLSSTVFPCGRQGLWAGTVRQNTRKGNHLILKAIVLLVSTAKVSENKFMSYHEEHEILEYIGNNINRSSKRCCGIY